MKPCNALIAGQPNYGRLISHTNAKALLEHYLTSQGEVQPHRNDPNHIFGYLFGLSVLKQFLNKIDQHNIDTTDLEQQITAVRIYRSKSKRNDQGAMLSDVLIVPVRRNGIDFPQSLVLENDDEWIVCDSGPCPNVCEQLYFFNEE